MPIDDPAAPFGRWWVTAEPDGPAHHLLLRVGPGGVIWWIADPLWSVLTVLSAIGPVLLLVGAFTRQPLLMLASLPLTACGIPANLRATAWMRQHSWTLQLRFGPDGIRSWERGTAEFRPWATVTAVQLPIGDRVRLGRLRVDSADGGLRRLTRLDHRRSPTWPVPPELHQELARQGLRPQGPQQTALHYLR